jgi:5-methylcytosine-specific restriction endonuclease McrA
MVRRADVPCAGGCGRLCWRSADGTPATCRDCRARARQRTCEQCGKIFDRRGRPGKPPPRFCSPKCFTDSIRLYDDPRAASKASSRMRKAQHRRTWDGVTDPQIYQRDGWECQIPGCDLGPMRPDLGHRHPLYPTIDHIVPLSRGGEDTQANKRAAHLECNIRRGNAMHDGEPRIVRLALTPERGPVHVKIVHMCTMCTATPVRREGATCASCKQAAKDAMRKRILAMREHGDGWQQIADELGLSGPGAAHNIAYPPWDRYDWQGYAAKKRQAG